MEITDPTHFGLQIVRLGLVTQAQYKDVIEEARHQAGHQSPELIFITRALERRGLMTNYQTSKVLKGDNEGFFLGGYRILYKIKSGSFGRVFRADDRTGRAVAIKVLRRRWSEDQARIDLFIREGRMGLTLKHPNIVEVLAINQDPVTRQYYIIMEFVEGGDLRQILQARKEKLSVAEALKLLQDMAEGLAYAYSVGLTHRDIKLTNILCSSAGEAKLVDFGLAQMFASISREDEHVDRTVDYAGLERATGVRQGDVRSDIFFLGCVFFEMLTGRPPLTMSKDRHQRAAKRRFEEVQSLRPGEIEAPASVYALCDTMLAFDPKRRYQTPSQLLDAVKAARQDTSGPLTEASVAAGPAKPAGKSIFLAESDQKYQERLRELFKGMGYRVFLASDPARALDRFRQQPFDVLIIDAKTVGEDGLIVFDSLLREANDRRVPVTGVLLLGQEQADWAGRITPRQNATVLHHPVQLNQLRRALRVAGNGK